MILRKGFESLINHPSYNPLRFGGGKVCCYGIPVKRNGYIGSSGCDYPAIVSYRMILMGTNPISGEYYDRFYKASTFCNTAIYHVKNVTFLVPANEKS